MLGDSPEYRGELKTEWSGEFRIRRLVFGLFLLAFGLAESFILESLELLSDFDALGTLFPCLMPVDIGGSSRSCSDCLKHPLGRVLTLGTFGSTGLFKVVDQDFGSFADLPEIDGSSTLGEEEQSVKLLKEHGRGLMDGAENGLSVFGELSEELQNVPRGLRVQSRGGLVKEKEELGLGDKLDTDGQPLPLFDVET